MSDWLTANWTFLLSSLLMKYRPSAGSNRFTEVLIPAAPVIGLIVDVDTISGV